MPAAEGDALAEPVRVATEVGVLTSARLGDREGHRFADDSVALYLWLASRLASPANAAA